MEKSFVIIVDDHLVVRDSLKILFSTIDGYEIIDEADSGEQLLKIIDKNIPDIIILDITMPGILGTILAKHLNHKYPTVKIILFSGLIDDMYIIDALEAGVSILAKNADRDELTLALNETEKGKQYISESVKLNIIKGFATKLKCKKQINEKYNLLTTREKEVFQLIVDGLTIKETSKVLNISRNTSMRYLNNIYECFNIYSNADIVKLAKKYNLHKV